MMVKTMFESATEGEEQMRDIELESILNAALANGHHIWVIGDVHGCADPLIELLGKLELTEYDHVVLLGDLIDRGPASARVIELVREKDHIHTIKGNHEYMMIEAMNEMNKRGHASMDTLLWVSNGGTITLDSFDDLYGNESEARQAEAKVWLEQLPSQIVLNGFRLVHAGYDPNLAIEYNTDAEMLGVRSPFHSHPEPLDEVRQIIFGHTPTQAIRIDGKKPGTKGQPLESPVQLEDGRPSWIGIDTGACKKEKENPTLTAYDLQKMVFKEVRLYD
jgi:serine/threonine protein phosphatase 1